MVNRPFLLHTSLGPGGWRHGSRGEAVASSPRTAPGGLGCKTADCFERPPTLRGLPRSTDGRDEGARDVTRTRGGAAQRAFAPVARPLLYGRLKVTPLRRLAFFATVDSALYAASLVL